MWLPLDLDPELDLLEPELERLPELEERPELTRPLEDELRELPDLTDEPDEDRPEEDPPDRDDVDGRL